MINLKLFTKKRSKIDRIGLDIGSYAVKIVSISDTPARPLLTGLGMKKIFGLSKEEASGAVKGLVEELKLPSKEAAISVSGPSVVVRFLSMPKMDEADLCNAVKFEAEKLIPFDIKDCVFDFQVLKKEAPRETGQHASPEEKGPKPIEGIRPEAGGADAADDKLKILLAVAKKEHLLDKIDVAQRAGLTVTLVDIDSFALANSFARNFSMSGKNKVSALVNIGAGSTNLSILKGGTISFVRDSAIGSRDFNDAISKYLHIGVDAAEEIKISGKEKGEEMRSRVKPVMDSFLDDIKLSFGYYENQGGASIDEIYLSGGAAGMAGLGETLQEAFAAKPNYWDPFGFLDKKASTLDINLLGNMRNYFAVAVGLASR